MFKILLIFVGLLILLNLTYGITPRSRDSTRKTNATVLSRDKLYDDYYDYYYYDYDTSNADKHKIKLNFIVFLIVFCKIK